MDIKNKFRFLYQSGIQCGLLISFSRYLSTKKFLKFLSVFVDLFILFFYGLEVSSSKVNVKKLVIGHSTGVVLGGNGIACSGTLHVSSGVCFARKYNNKAISDDIFFRIEGDLIVGTNTVIEGPIKIVGPTIIGAVSLVNKDILVPGIYAGIPAKKIG